MRAPPRLPADVIHRVLADDEACLAVFFHWRWPNGFICPRCEGTDGRRIAHRPAWRCSACNHHARVTAGTALHRTRLPLWAWLKALLLIGDRKQSVSALQLQRDLGIGCYETIWTMLHIIRDVMDDGALLHRGLVEMATQVLARDDVRAQGTDAEDERRILGFAIERIDVDAQDPDRRFSRIRLVTVHAPALVADVQRVLAAEGATVRRADRPISAVVLRNLRDFLRGTFHGVSIKYFPAYAREFVFRFNRRRRTSILPALIGKRLLRLSARKRAELKSPRALCAALPEWDDDLD